MYSISQTIFHLFFAYEYQNYAEFYADSKSIEMIGEKKCTEKDICQKHMQVSSIEVDKLYFCTIVLPLTFLLANFSHSSCRSVL
jgi:hypothetical protein